MIWAIDWAIWGLFFLDYFVRLSLPLTVGTGFCGTCSTSRSLRCHCCGHFACCACLF